jgi:hypothetical protein
MRKITMLAVALVCLIGCARQPPVWTAYDACSTQTSNFVAMVECGKQKRTAACQQANECTAVGNAFVQYADALAMQVQNKQITEADALKQFAEYKTTLLGNVRRDQAIVAAGVAAASGPSGPTTCTRTGNTVTCF